MANARLSSLARWLGPWSKGARVPKGVEQTSMTVAGHGGRAVEVWVYRGRRPRGTLILWPGLHFEGPAERRSDRFARILANAGYTVFSPFLPDFLSQRLEPAIVDDALAVFDAVEALPKRPAGAPGMMSISFGSYPALRVAAARGDRVGGLLIFGGYAEWDTAMRFSLAGGDDVPHDPLNRPVVFINLFEHLPGAPEDPAPVLAAWRSYMEATWGRPEMKADDRWRPLARRIGETLSEPHQSFFYRGVGLTPGQIDMAEKALSRAGGRAWLDPRPHMGDINCPVYLVHGRDDDVIPVGQAELLREALPQSAHAGSFLTGWYGHTQAAGGGGVGALVGELKTMTSILKAMARLAP